MGTCSSPGTPHGSPDPNPIALGDRDARIESLAEAAGVYLPEYEASLPPAQRIAPDVEREL